MTSAEQPDALYVWRELLRFHRRTVAALDAELQSARGLTLDEYDVLLQLAEADAGGLTMGELAAGLVVARSSCTRIVDRLVSAGLVVRRSAPEDRRSVVISLTSEGRRAQRRAGATHVRGVQDRFVSRLRSGDLESLTRLLARLQEI